MGRRTTLLLLQTCVMVFCLRMGAQTPAPSNSKIALLIGIDKYDHPASELKVPDGTPRTGRYEPDIAYADLMGPSHDVAAMRSLLTDEKFAFHDDHIHTLLNEQATRAGILAAMQRYLVDEPKAGDSVVLYISSHGSLRADPHGTGILYDLDGTGKHPSAVENTIVPYDWYLGSDDIFSRDLRHIFNLAADKGVHLTAIFDSCHSGLLSRGIGKSHRVARAFDFDPRPISPSPYPAAEATRTAPTSRIDNTVLVLSAAQKDQSAVDVQDSTPPHGLFTSILIETLEALPANRPVEDVFKRLQVGMELEPDSTYQQPVLDASPARRQLPLFPLGPHPKSTFTASTAAVVAIDPDGILLDIGTASDVGVGSQFTTIRQINGTSGVLDITKLEGFARSRATVAPAGFALKVGDIVELTKAVAAERPTLYFYGGAGTLPSKQIQDALNILRAANIHLAADPSADPWTQHIAWDGKNWLLNAHSGPGQHAAASEPPATLGPVLTPAALSKLSADSIVWFDPPLPSESAAQLLPKPAPGDPARPAQLTTDRGQLTYIVAASPTADAIRYAWFKRKDVDAEIQTPKGMGAGCSPGSSYPLRTNWFASPTPDAVGAELTDSAMTLSRLNGWLQLQSSPLSGREDFPYTLGLRSTDATTDVAQDGNTFAGKNYGLALTGSIDAEVTPRWVYVLGIDCQGKGSLVWPYTGGPSGGRFPTDKGRLARIPLPGEAFPVSDPLGTDTYLLITTSTPLSDPYSLEFGGAVTRSAGPASPQDQFVSASGAGTRGAPTPTQWSVQTLVTHSVPTSDTASPPAATPQKPTK